MKVAALCVDRRSVYRLIDGVECYDKLRDARSYNGPWPVVAHPPCAQWGRLKGLAKANEEMKALGPLCVSLVRRFGGILEHPAASSLWSDQCVPRPAKSPHSAAGFTLSVSQSWFGHRADKPTWLYFVGIRPTDLAPLPCPQFNGEKMVEEMSVQEREATPIALARWLVENARRCVPRNMEGGSRSPIALDLDPPARLEDDLFVV